MPDRIVRDELLHSERYWSVGIDAQRLFIHLMLCADNLARYSGKNYTIRSACYPGKSVDPKLVERLIDELAAADLIRLYAVAGERYVFIPRFKQRLRYMTSKYPDPPKEINDIVIEKSDSSQTQVRPQSVDVIRSEVVPSRAPKNPGAAKGLNGDTEEAKSTRRSTWEAYSTAYFNRYKTEPLKDAQANSLIAQFCKRIPGSEAPAIAAFYVAHNKYAYVNSKHDLKLMLASAAGLHTDWKTGQQTTDSQSRKLDQGQAQGSVWAKLQSEQKAIT